MIKVAIVTYNKNPYRNLQFVEYSKIRGIELNVYYCKEIDREWNVDNVVFSNMNEKNLLRYKFSTKVGCFNKNLKKIVKNNDLIILGGYDQPTYIVLSMLCKIFRKKYCILFDGISTNKLKQNKRSLKFKIKDFVISNSMSILANGSVGKEYFKRNFNYPSNKIYNQYLTVDIDKITKNNIYKLKYREELRKKYNISLNKKVILYSGRLINLKNVDSIIKAINLLGNKQEYTLFITGGGIEEKKLLNLAKGLEVDIRITGFIREQEELFLHYYIADVFMLLSTDEAWGLVVNEAMATKLPLIISNICGCSMDFVKDGINGFLVDPYNLNDISSRINEIFKKDLNKMGEESFKMIQKWTVKEAREQLEILIKNSKMV